MVKLTLKKITQEKVLTLGNVFGSYCTAAMCGIVFLFYFAISS